MSVAINIIKDEHRSLGAVLHGMQHLVQEIRAGTLQPDFDLLQAMMRYIEEFPEKLHHPKEDEYLSRILRAREPASAPVLDEMEAEHLRGHELMHELAAALTRYRAMGSIGLEAFRRALGAYAQFHWEHMRKEEEQVLPMAKRAFTPEDWKVVDEAFLSNSDPIAGVDTRREFRELFRRIANLAPPPIGVGPRKK